VSGYLQRLVSRHSSLPAVRPRGTSRFEGGLASGIAVLDTATTAAPPAVEDPPPAAPPRRPAVRVRPPDRVHPPAAPAAVTEMADGPSARPVMARPKPVTPEPVRTSATDANMPEPTAIAVAKGDEPEAQVPPGPRGTGPEPVTLRRARPAHPARHDGGNASVARRRGQATTEHEPDVVRVHIGRVEVRAVIAAPQPAMPAARPSGPAPLSLDRYLSGERRA
jgi:hypothetical protein